MISYDEFKKVEVRAGKILSTERIEGSDKLLKLSVDLGEKTEEGGVKPRQILSGILKYFPEPEVLVGKTTLFVANLAPREMMGLSSEGMLFAIGGKDEVPFTLITPEEGTPPGTLAA